jgi:hypothetical protein
VEPGLKTRLASSRADEAAHVKAESAQREQHPALGRWLRQTPSGRLTLDRRRSPARPGWTGSTLLSTSDPDLPAEDVALGKMAIETSQGLLVAGLLAERIGTTLPGRRRATS